jgi:hypothetical protein
MNDDQEEPVTISIDFGEDSNLDLSDTTVIDLSNYGAAQPALTFPSGTASGSVLISGGGSGTISGSSFNWSNNIAGSGFTFGNDYHNEIVVRDGGDSIKLLATLRSWSEWLGMPLVYTNDSDINEHTILREVLAEWQEHLDKGDLASAKKCADNFGTLRKIIGKTNYDSKDN